MHPRRYLYLLSAAAVAAFGCAWLWILGMPLAYLDPEYASWSAKLEMLRTCDLGDMVVVGDSRAAVDIIPQLMPIKTTNLAVGGGEPIEAFVALSRALSCRNPPKRVVI